MAMQASIFSVSGVAAHAHLLCQVGEAWGASVGRACPLCNSCGQTPTRQIHLLSAMRETLDHGELGGTMILNHEHGAAHHGAMRCAHGLGAGAMRCAHGDWVL